MKRLLTIILTLSMLLALTACISNQSGPSADSVQPPQSNSTNSTTQTTPEAPTKTEQPTPNQQPESESSFEPFVIMEQDGIKVTLTGYMEADYEGQLLLLIENNTDQNICLQSGDVVANGFMVDTIMSVDVAAGKKANDNMELLSSSLQNCGIDRVSTLSFRFRVYTEGFDLLFESEPIDLTIGDPYKQITEYTDYDTVIYDIDGIKICGKGIYDMGGGELHSVYYIENNTAMDIVLQTDNVSVNGFMIDPIFSVEIAAGAKAVDGMQFLAKDLQANNIQFFDTMEFTFRIIDSDDYTNSRTTDIIVMEFDH